MKHPIITTLLVMLSCVALPSLAETIIVPVGQQGDISQQRPANGTTKQSVEDNYGAPQSVEGPIGDPAITQWKYDSFTVYFEHNRVIHTVLRK